MRHGTPSYVLLIDGDPTLHNAVAAACAALGAQLRFAPNLTAAIAPLIANHPAITHVLVGRAMPAADQEILAALLDETMQPPPRAIMLGGAWLAGLATLADASVANLTAALSPAPPLPGGQALPLTAGQAAAELFAGNIRMRFQPVVRAHDLHVAGLEALARLHSPSHGIIRPQNFLPALAAGGHGLAVAAIAAMRALFDIGRVNAVPNCYFSINLPLTTLFHPPAPHRARALCGIAGADVTRVVVEVLETVDRPDLASLGHALDRWRAQGFSTAIDDAGPGLPHWRELLKLPFDAVKLDGDMLRDGGNASLAAAITDAAHARGLFVVAEGVETADILARARAIGADALQGFYLSRPLPAAVLPAWLAQHQMRFEH